MIYVSVQIPFLLYKNLYYYKHITGNVLSIPLMLIEIQVRDRDTSLSQSLLTLSFWASPLTFSNSVIESTKPW